MIFKWGHEEFKWTHVVIGIFLGTIASILAWVITKNLIVGIISFFGLFVLALLVDFGYINLKTYIGFKKSGILNVYPNQYLCTEAVKSKLDLVKTIDILTIRGLGICGLKDSLMWQKLVERAGQIQVRILFLDPNSKYVEIRARELDENTDRYKKGILLAQDSFRELKDRRVTIEAKMYDALPIWRLMSLDQYLYVSSFLPSKEGHHSAIYEITAEEFSSLYNTFMREFEYLWSISTKYL